MANLFDSTNYPTTEPGTIVAGDRIAWKRSDLNSDYPVALYSLKYSARLENAGSTEIEITASESGTDYIVEVGQAVTVTYAAGIYHWQAYIIRTTDSERITIDSGTFEVKTNRDAATTDPRGHVKKVLDAIEATIEGRASKDQEKYAIAGRELWRTPIPDLIMLRDKYRAEYVRETRAERIRNGLGHSGIIKTRF
jgi:hypothetical protein